jgi:SAM-dependent methyltransferase
MEKEFDKYAAQYLDLLEDPLRDKFASPGFFHERKFTLIEEYFRRQNLDMAASSWLDIGCGLGDLLRMGRGKFGSVFGCDVSGEMLAGCRGLEVRRQEQEDSLPYGDRCMDFATAACVYHHVSPAKRPTLTREAARILKPGGTLCIIEHNPLNPVTRTIVSRSPVDVDARLLRLRETRRLLEDQGLAMTSICHFLFLPEALFRSFGRIERLMSRIPAGGQYAVFARRIR